jgi:hypothetical protein
VVGGGAKLALARPLTGLQMAMATEATMLRPSADRCTSAPAPPFPSALACGMSDAWPLRTFLELGALPGAVPCARLHTRQVLWEWNLTRLTESVELVVSDSLN